MRSASRASSATEPTASFSITRARWTLTVFSAVPSSHAICLFEQALDDQRADLPLSGAQRREPVQKRAVLVLMGLDGEASRQSRRDGCHQLRLVEGFLENIHGARLLRLHRERDIGVPADEDDRDRRVAGDSFLQLEARQAREALIEYQDAGRTILRWTREERARRIVRGDIESRGTKQTGDGNSHTRVVIDYEYADLRPLA